MRRLAEGDCDLHCGGIDEDELSLPFIPSIAETMEFCITTGYRFRHA